MKKYQILIIISLRLLKRYRIILINLNSLTKLISYLKKILKGIGELSSKNYNISYELSNKDELISKTQNIQRKTIEKEMYSSAINNNNAPKDDMKNDRQGIKNFHQIIF